ncbi:hypothetical protein BH23ACT12_BH23ACT12_15920 [soil metagenome]
MVTNARKLAGANRVWAGRAKDDLIRAATGLAFLGDDPTNYNFGAREIPTCCDEIGHSGYFKLGTASLDNLARILVGDYDAVR